MSNATKRLDGRKILIVEDEWLIADDLIRALEREGAQVVGPPASADHALYLLKTTEVHVAVLDIHLGAGRDIYAVAEELQRRKVPLHVCHWL